METRKMSVPLRASGAEKAEAVKKLLSRSITRKSDRIFTRKGITTYTATTRAGQLTLRWDSEGHYLYAASVLETPAGKRKVRNVAEALRLAAG